LFTFKEYFGIQNNPFPYPPKPREPMRQRDDLAGLR
jgi:hypothetical protein